MLIRTLLCAALIGTPGAIAYGTEPDDELTVVLRAVDGRFLTVDAAGAVGPTKLIPAEDEQFQLFEMTDGYIALKAAGGRFLTAAASGGRRLRADSLRQTPGGWESFLVVPADEDRVALKAWFYPSLVLISEPKAPVAGEELGPGPKPEETVEVFRFGEIPSTFQNLLSVAIRGVVNSELGKKQYSKVRRNTTDRYIELPAPTLNNLKRTKRHQWLGVTEEYHIGARIDGTPEITVQRMPYLTSYRRPESALLIFVVDVRLPVTGQVSYKVPKLLSATTGYRTVVHLNMVGEIRVSKQDDQVTLSPMEARRVVVSLAQLDLSNDILQTARKPIERTINGELRKNNARILTEANKELHKAIDLKEFRHPLLKYLKLP